jgi:3-hydroxyacyl-CoA dehydrogenase/NADPH:quinone reductase-like Zn-dependent oxidoreductase
VGILGAGMMGGGIAWANASRGIPCVLKDVSLEQAMKGRSYGEKLAEKRNRPQAPGLITPTADAKDLEGCDLIIEAVFEKRDVKAQATKEAEPMLAPGGFFASNTSTLPISGLAQAFSAPERFIGLHFFSPVDKMQLVEIIKGKQTSAETLARAYDYVLQLGKIPIVVNDSRGFYTSRTFGTFVAEGCCMLQEGIPAAVIENAGRLAGMPVGPLAVIDETSMSLSVAVMEQTKADLEAEGKKYTPQPGQEVLVRMVKEFKRPGRAGGGGFYEYPKEGRKYLWPELAKHLRQEGRVVGLRGAEGAHPLSPGDRDGALPRRRRARARARRQHRLGVRHRLSRLDGRRAAVREPRRREAVREARRRAREEARAALRAAEAAQGPRFREENRMNQRIVLASYPEGWVTESNFRLESAPIPKPGEGEVLVKNHWLSLDPYMRGRMSQQKSYVKGVEPGEVMTGETAGEVVESKHPGVQAGRQGDDRPGRRVAALLVREGRAPRQGGRLEGATLLLPRLPRHARAHGLVRHEGHLPAQARRDGGRVGGLGRRRQRRRAARQGLGLPRVGIAGGSAKCDYVVKELGFDACVDYKAGKLLEDLRAACPKGIDANFENVGGPTLDTVLRLMNLRGRIAICGLISDYNAKEPYGVKMMRSILVNRLKVQGMIVFDWAERYPEANRALLDLDARRQAEVPRIHRAKASRTRPRG